MLLCVVKLFLAALLARNGLAGIIAPHVVQDMRVREVCGCFSAARPSDLGLFEWMRLFLLTVSPKPVNAIRLLPCDV